MAGDSQGRVGEPTGQYTVWVELVDGQSYESGQYDAPVEVGKAVGSLVEQVLRGYPPELLAVDQIVVYEPAGSVNVPVQIRRSS